LSYWLRATKVAPDSETKTVPKFSSVKSELILNSMETWDEGEKMILQWLTDQVDQGENRLLELASSLSPISTDIISWRYVLQQFAPLELQGLAFKYSTTPKDDHNFNSSPLKDLSRRMRQGQNYDRKYRSNSRGSMPRR